MKICDTEFIIQIYFSGKPNFSAPVVHIYTIVRDLSLRQLKLGHVAMYRCSRGLE